MSPIDKRRAAARRRAWGRGPVILRFEPLEGRQLLATTTALPDLAAGAFDTPHNLDWGDTFHARGVIENKGNAPVASAFHVDIYASTTPTITANSVLIGEATIPAGLQAGGESSFDQVVSLPATALSGVDASNAIYIDLVIDPEGNIAESNRQNNSGTGQGYDVSLVTITPHQPSNLVGTSLGVYPDQAAWGGTVTVNAQITNNAAGDAPATRARVVLTPTGFAVGGINDVTIGSIPVPAIGAWQNTTVSKSFTLPGTIPTALSGYSTFTLSLIQDADFVTNQNFPHVPSQGSGLDQVSIAITTSTGAAATSTGPMPDLTVTSVQAPTLPVVFGRNFQVSANIQNLGNLDAGPYKVRFLLVGTSGALTNAVFLGDATLSGLKAGFSQTIVQNLQIPVTVGGGIDLNSSGSVGIAVLVDPENTISELKENDKVGYSQIITVVQPGSTVTAATTTATNTSAAASKSTTKAATSTNTTTPKTKVKRPVKVKHTIRHDLKVFPNKVGKYFKKVFK
jgi:hypothetical protein